MNRDEWIEAFARELGLEPPSAAEIDGVLELAATAAHASERTAAPVACWLGASSGQSIEALNRISKTV